MIWVFLFFMYTHSIYPAFKLFSAIFNNSQNAFKQRPEKEHEVVAVSKPTFCVNAHFTSELRTFGVNMLLYCSLAHLVFSQTEMNVMIGERGLNHNIGCSRVPAFRCSRAERSRCIRVGLLEKSVHLMPAGSWRAWPLDNYPEEYQNPSAHNKRGPQMHVISPVTVLKIGL